MRRPLATDSQTLCLKRTVKAAYVLLQQSFEQVSMWSKHMPSIERPL